MLGLPWERFGYKYMKVTVIKTAPKYALTDLTSSELTVLRAALRGYIEPFNVKTNYQSLAQEILNKIEDEDLT